MLTDGVLWLSQFIKVLGTVLIKSTVAVSPQAEKRVVIIISIIKTNGRLVVFIDFSSYLYFYIDSQNLISVFLYIAQAP